MKINSFGISKVVYCLLAVLCLFPIIDPPIALLLGFILSFTLGNPFKKITKKLTKILLQVSIVGLGFGMNIHEALSVGKEGLLFTVISIVTTIILGILLGRFFKVSRNTTLLVSSGTAICGGSAIAAISPIINADENDTSVSLAVIFILNSIALFIFPIIGNMFHLSQEQFGFWSAIAIHDTSSVVGAAQKYGDKALQIATTVKLERALWIVPLSLIMSFFFRDKSRKGKMYIPYFILFYIIAMLINSFIPQVEVIGKDIVFLSKRCLTLTLFLIGTSISKQTLKEVGVKPFLLGISLWIFISVMSLFVILGIK